MALLEFQKRIRMVEFCAESWLCVGNTHFEHRSLYNYTRMARDQDGVEIKSVIDLVLVKRICCVLYRM